MCLDTPRRPLLTMTKDTRNHPLWNPEIQDNMLDKQSAELARFNARFGDVDVLAQAEDAMLGVPGFWSNSDAAVSAVKETGDKKKAPGKRKKK